VTIATLPLTLSAMFLLYFDSVLKERRVYLNSTPA
jgi:hypothetical protein